MSDKPSLEDAVIELLAVAQLRGDNELPQPCDDPKLWTARMQDAWDAIAEAIELARPGAVDREMGESRRWERGVRPS